MESKNNEICQKYGVREIGTFLIENKYPQYTVTLKWYIWKK